jgi:hypothetical protein
MSMSSDATRIASRTTLWWWSRVRPEVATPTR